MPPLFQKRGPINSVHSSLLVLFVYGAYPRPAEKAAGEFPCAPLLAGSSGENGGEWPVAGGEELMAVCWEFLGSCAGWFIHSPGECESPAPMFAQWEI